MISNRTTTGLAVLFSIATLLVGTACDPDKFGDHATLERDKQGGTLLNDTNDLIGDFLKAGQTSDGRHIVAYFNESQGGLTVGIERTPGSREFDYQLIKVPGQIIGLYNDLAVDAEDRVHIVTFSRTERRPLYISGKDGNFSEPEAVVAEVGDRYLGLWPSIAVDRKNQPHISFYDETHGDLYYATLQEGSWQVERVQPMFDATTPMGAMDIGRYSAILVEDGGSVAIAAYFVGEGDLYLLRAEPTDAARVWIATAIDKDYQANVGAWVDMIAGPNGLKWIAYYDATNDHLKFVRQRDDLSFATPVVVDSRGGTDISLQRIGDKAFISCLAPQAFDLHTIRETETGVFEINEADRRGVTGFFTASVCNNDCTTYYHQSFYQQSQQKVLVYP